MRWIPARRWKGLECLVDVRHSKCWRISSNRKRFHHLVENFWMSCISLSAHILQPKWMNADVQTKHQLPAVENQIHRFDQSIVSDKLFWVKSFIRFFHFNRKCSDHIRNWYEFILPHVGERDVEKNDSDWNFILHLVRIMFCQRYA